MLKFDLTISTLHLTVSPGQNCSLSLSAHHPLSWLWILIISLARGRSLSKGKKLQIPHEPSNLLSTRISRYQICFSLYAKSARCHKVCSVGGNELSMAVFDIKVFRTAIATGLDVFYLAF